ncbi:MAG: dihydroxyacetone kinase subunit L [Sedimentisphaerales bacterium]|nr:dihydroxyacetone kinase subunit L [Sedimentisphaerales bacterium]
MSDTLDYQGLVNMLLGAAGQIRENHRRLSELDSFGGDGDHGTTMLRAMENLEKSVASSRGGQMKQLLSETAWAVMGTDGGATGPLFGSFFMGMSNGAGQEERMDCVALASMFEAALECVRKRTKAEAGDKTIMDAMIPAVEQARLAADDGFGICGILERAAEAARRGADSTKDLQPRLGRAKNAAEQSLGHEDPGAVSVSLIFKGFLKGALEDGG